ncbi:MAG TPA: alpha/beta fold hydrolase [Polyangia bacterium]
MARVPYPGLAMPGDIQFSPDGTHVAFLWSEDGSLNSGLWVTSVADGQTRCVVPPSEAALSDEQRSSEAQLARERRRQLRVGVDTVSWGPFGATLFVPAPGRITAYDVRAETATVVLRSEGVESFKLSPDGGRIAFTQGGDLWCLDLAPMPRSVAAPGQPRRLTTSATETIRCGVADYISQEELGRHDGYWWHPSGLRVLFVEVDETSVASTVLPDSDGRGGIRHRYPYAGTANARWRLGMVDVASGEVSWIDLRSFAREYLATAQFDPQGRIVVQVLARDQRELLLLRIADEKAAPELLSTERASPWLNLHGEPRFLPDGGFLRVSERGDLPQIERLDAGGNETCLIAAPAGGVRRLVAADPETGTVFFTGFTDDPRRQDLFSAALDGGGVALRLSDQVGWNDAHADRLSQVFVRTHHGLRSAPRAWLQRRDGSTIADLPRDRRRPAPTIEPPELLELEADDGRRLFGALYLPLAAPHAAPFPLAVAVYGGPHHQAVRDAWDLTVDLRAQRLARAGIAVLKLDNRGTGGRGLGFEKGLERRFGQIEVEDQVRAVRFLIDRGTVDPKRVAVYGWSYGGYMAARCLFRAPDVFKAAVVGAPVVSWQLYDTAYTERYLGPLQTAEDHEIYERASLLADMPERPGPMLIVHGLRDENVLFQHTTRLLEALNIRGKKYDLLLFPDERHSVRKPGNRAYLESRMHQFLAAQLLENAGG